LGLAAQPLTNTGCIFGLLFAAAQN